MIFNSPQDSLGNKGAESNNLSSGSSTESTDLTKAVTDLLNKTSKQAEQTEATLDRIKDTQKQINETRTMVYIGFIVLIAIVVGLVIAYIQLSVTTYGAFLDKVNSSTQNSPLFIVTPTQIPTLQSPQSSTVLQPPPQP